jgi:cellulose synthase (UDP-forming)
VAELARELGARYVSRPDNRDAKAGNLNHALQVVDADIVAVVDADHVPGPDFLRNTLAYFDDPSVALVQTPQDFYNLDSFEHERRRDGDVFLEEAVFYRVIAAGKNRWGAAFWCGTSALLRTAALRDVGGVATGSVTEDMHTTIRLHRRGWKSVYHNEVLVRGLAPRTAHEYLAQRRRWAAGAMQVMRIERPITGRGLTLGQRLGYAATLWAWWDSWRTLGYVVLPVVVIATGAVPIAAPLAVFGPLFLTVLGVQFLALRLLARGYYPPVLSLVFEFLRMPAVVPGTLALLRPQKTRFAVTPKGPSDEGRQRVSLPLLMRALLVIAPAGLVWFALTVSGLTPLSYPEPGVAVGAAGFLAANMLLLVAAARRIRSSRFATDQRRGVRLPVRLDASFAGRACVALDVSLTGARLAFEAEPEPVEADGGELVLGVPGHTIVLRCSVQRRAESVSGSELGVRFLPGQRRATADLAFALFSLSQGLAARAPSGPDRGLSGEDGSRTETALDAEAQGPPAAARAA